MTWSPGPDLTIDGFEAGQIDAERFDHIAHVYVGWLYVQSYDLAEALARFDRALKRLTENLGIPGKYHATITWTFLLLIKERSRPRENWQSFLSRNADLVNDSKDVLDRYYSGELLNSARARAHYVLPDRLAR